MRQEMRPCSDFQALVAVPLVGHTKIQQASCQPLKTECSNPSDSGLENGHIRNSSLTREKHRTGEPELALYETGAVFCV